MDNYNVIDLFAGAGGLSNGFEQTNRFRVIAACEKNRYARQTYEHNHLYLGKYFKEDVHDVKYSEIVEELEQEIDIVIGGPPCQGFSNANRQRNHLINSNNELVKEYIRIVKEIKPLAFVMENVKMFASPKHKFFWADDNEAEFLELEEQNLTSSETFYIDSLKALKGVLKEDITNRTIFKEYMISERSYSLLNIFYKYISHEKRLRDELERKESSIKQVQVELKKILMNLPNNVYGNEMRRIILNFDICEFKVCDLFKENLKEMIILQRLFSKLEELVEYRIFLEGIDIDDYEARIHTRSVTVLDYVLNSLESKYSIGKAVLNAVNFGVPQKRERFIMIGINKELIDNEELNMPVGDELVSTVRDAISDLESVQPYKDLTDDLVTIPESGKRVANHINTKTREIAQKRFEKLGQGQNFHDLSEDMKTTYTEPGRTQNSIYLRLDYDKPSNTVTNVRKSMWVHPIENRAVSIREAARLQSFPDDFIFMGSKDSQYQQVGNAVPPQLGKRIAEHILNLLKNKE